MSEAIPEPPSTAGLNSASNGGALNLTTGDGGSVAGGDKVAMNASPTPPPQKRLESPSGPTHPPSPLVEATFLSALECSPEQRDAFVAEACAGDDALQADVRAMLAMHQMAGNFMDASPISPEIESEMARLKPEEEGERIGRYKLLQEIGEGGFGTVWMAEQLEPVSRRVAFKIIKLGMDTREVIARFEAERQALAMMDHPNIAKVFDAGATEKGRPYFVMELVKGIPITQYCDEAGLGTRERLELFGDVCSAINHAHQKGVIHRDIKPSNVMITLHGDKAVVKVIDFGIAKATQGRLTDKTFFTRFEQFIGTPVYMSPEQASMSGLDVDTRSDIYALGILLYELLTGKPPFDARTLASAGYDEMRRIIREVDPPTPSSRISTMARDERTVVAKARQIEPEKLNRLVEPDLDWIVMKAIDKDRTRRYETANGLAADIQRFLDDELVSARPPTAGYQLHKFARRHKAQFRVAAGIAVVLIVATAVSSWQAVRADREAKRAVSAFDELRATAPAFLEQARGLAAKEQFEKAIEKLDYALKLRPEDAEILVAKGDLLQCQFKIAEAAVVYREVLRVQSGHARAKASANLCDELLAAKPNDDGNLNRESLARLHLAMQRQQRSAAELLPVARLLGEEKKLLVEYWLDRLKDLPVSAERPLKDRLTVRDDGRLALDLSDTKVTDLSPLAGAPIAVLDVSGFGEPRELTDLSPLRGIELIELNINLTSVADITPLSDMRALETLAMAATKVTNVSALKGLSLVELNIARMRTSDLSPLRGMKLKKLNIRETRVSDLSPLAGMPLTYLDTSSVPAVDYSPLAGAPLETVIFQNSPIRDISFLRDAPVKEIRLNGCNAARGFAVLTGFKALDLVLLPEEFRSFPDEEQAVIIALRAHPTLKILQIGLRTPALPMSTPPQSRSDFFKEWDLEQTFVPALRANGFKFTLSKLPNGTYALRMDNQPLSDLSILKGAPVSDLILSNCRVSDLTPIRDLKLERFFLASDSVADLSPLRGMPLKSLYLAGSKITDLSPLTALPLRELYLDDCRSVTDVAALAKIPTLEKVTVPPGAGKIEELRGLSRLQMLAFNRNMVTNLPASTVDDFWKDFRWISRLREVGIKANLLQRLEDGTWLVDLLIPSIADLSVLQGAPISDLRLGNSSVLDLTPLRGMAIKKLWLTGTAVTDLSPLKGIPIEFLSLSGNTHVADLSALRGMPLVELRLHRCSGITDVSPLAASKTLQMVVLPPNAKNFEFLRTFPQLGRISFEDDPKNYLRPDMTAAEFWQEFGQRWAMALRNAGMKYTAKLDEAGRWEVTVTSREFSDCSIFQGASIKALNLKYTSVGDLRPLEDLPLTRLEILGTRVTDLTPLRAPQLSASLRELDIANLNATDYSPVAACTKLEFLAAYGSPVPSDLNFLRDLKLRRLWLARTKVSDISVLAGMPLTELYIDQSEITDLSPLLHCPTLQTILLPATAIDAGALRALPALEYISYEFKSGPSFTAVEFWKKYDARKN